ALGVPHARSCALVPSLVERLEFFCQYQQCCCLGQSLLFASQLSLKLSAVTSLLSQGRRIDPITASGDALHARSMPLSDLLHMQSLLAAVLAQLCLSKAHRLHHHGKLVLRAPAIWRIAVCGNRSSGNPRLIAPRVQRRLSHTCALADLSHRLVVGGTHQRQRVILLLL